MSRTKKSRLKFRHIMSALGLVGIVIVLFVSRHQLTSFLHLLKNLRWYVLVVVVAIQIFSYFINAFYYRSILKIFRYDLGLMRLFEGALAANFVNYILPSAGFAGAGYLSQVLSPEVPRGESVLMQLMRYALSSLAVLVMMPVGLFLIYISGDSGHSVVRVSIYASIGILVFALVVVAMVAQETLLRRLIKWINKTLKKLFKKYNGESAVNYFANEFFIGFRAMANKKIEMLKPFGWSIVYIIIEISTVYLTFLAFGKVVNPGIVIMGYLFANIASIFGGVFFSTGVFELGMIGTFVALGVPFALALSVTIVYRVMNLLIGLPPGYYYYKKYLP